MKILKEINLFNCRRCLKHWEAKSENPKRCAKCNSPYWNKERENQTNKEARLHGQQSSKYGFEKMQVGVPMLFPWPINAKGEIDSTEVARKANAFNQYMGRHGYHWTENNNSKGWWITRRT